MHPFLVAHLSDLHIAPGLAGAEARRIFTWCVDDLVARVAAGLTLSAIVVNGDVRHGADTPAERNLLAMGVQRLAHIAPVVVNYGNHDRPGDLDFLAYIAAPFPIIVCATPRAVTTPSGLVLAMLPWLHRVQPADDVRTYSLDDAAARERATLVTTLDALAADADATALATGCPVVFCGHVMLEGAVPGLGQPTKTGREFILSLDDLARVSASAYLLGHVHDPQGWRIGDAPVEYSGCPYVSAHGEDPAKRYMLASVTRGGAVTIESVRTPTTPMVTIEDSWEGADALGRFGWRSMKWSNPPDVRGADVRFSYEVEHADRAEARRAALSVKAAIEGAGAVRCKLDPKVAPAKRARLTAFAAAQSLGDKLGCYMTREQIDPTSPRARLAYTFLADVERSIGAARGGVATGGMRLHSISARGVGPFRDPVRLDVDALPDGVNAVWGRIGAGKSTLLGCWPGVMHGTIPGTPTNRPIGDFATTPDALVSVEVSGPDGARWELQRQLARGGAAFARPVGGEPVSADGKVTKFRTWADANLVPSAVLLNGPFCAQESRGMVTKRPAERKDVLLAALGCDHLERGAKVSRDNSAACKVTLATIAGQVAAEERRAARLPADTGAAVAGAREAHARAVATAADVEAREEQRRAARAAGERAEAAGWALRHADDEVRRIEGQAAESAAVLGQAPAIREAAREDAEIAERLRALDAEEAREARETERLTERRGDVVALLFHAQATSRAAEERRAGADDAHDAADRAVDDARDSDHGAACAVAGIDMTIATLAANLDAARAAQATGLDARVTKLRAGLTDVLEAGDIEEAKWDAHATLASDDAMVAAHATADATLNDVTRALAVATTERATRVTARGEQAAALTRCEDAARAALAILDAATAALATATANRDALTAELATLDARLMEREHDTTQRALDRRNLTTARERLAPLASLAAALDRAEATRDALAPTLATARDKAIAARAAVDALPPVPCEPPAYTGPSLDALRREAQATAARVALAEQHATDATTIAATLAGLRAQRETADGDRAAWDLLADALGKNGIQAMEIDAAGPELTARMNGLLHDHFGTRWTASIDTACTNANGEQIDGMPILICDSQTDREDDIATYSGGEKTILGCAFAGALAGFVCARAGAELPTFVLDEAGAAVDVEMTEAYVLMVRQVAAEIGASKVLLVTHNPEVVALCDGVIRVADGGLTVDMCGARG